MTRINLLPWREKYVDIQNRRFGLFCGLAVVLSLFISLIFKIILGLYLSNIFSDQEYLLKETAKANVKMQEVSSLLAKKNSLLKRIKIIEKLQVTRNLGAEILHDIAQSLPDNIVLIEVYSKDNKVKITGVAASNNDVSKYMSNVDKNTWVAEAVLSEIKNNDLVNYKNINHTISAAPIKFNIDINLKV